MAANSRDSWTVTENKFRVVTSGVTNTNTLDSGRMEKCMEKAECTGQMERSMMDSGSNRKCMDRESKDIQMVAHMREVSTKVSNMEMVC